MNSPATRLRAALAGLALGGLTTLGLLASAAAPQATPGGTDMPVAWDMAYMKILTPDEARLEKGEVLFSVRYEGQATAYGQTMGVVNAPPRRCYDVVVDYDRYKDTMPLTEESKAVRSFTLPGGFKGVDFYTSVGIWPSYTRYLLRIAHGEDAATSTYKTWWTLVGSPETACKDEDGDPCANDLATNLGSHLMVPFKGDNSRTLHTYTVRLDGKSAAQKTILDLLGETSMKKVTMAIRTQAEGKK